MRQKAINDIWIAVRVERGFPVEARGFRNKDSAIQVERKWRGRMNPDYDETGVLLLNMTNQ